MTRVGFISPGIHVGGAERWILTLAKHFVNAKPAGLVVTQPWYNRETCQEAVRAMPVWMQQTDQADRMPPGVIPFRYDTQAIGELAERSDILLSWGVSKLAMMTADVNIPVVEVSHSDGSWQEQTQLVRSSALGASHWAAVSRTATTAFPPQIPRSSITVIYNGVEVDRITPRLGRAEVRKHWSIESSDRLILFLGRFSQEKAPERILDAMHHLPTHWKAVFVGHGPSGHTKMLRDRAQAELSGRVMFLDPQTQVGDLMAAADVLALPSDTEGMPLTLLEAWLAKLPVVTTRFTFAREIASHFGPLMRIVDLPPNPMDFADEIMEASRDDDMVALAHHIAMQNFTASAMCYRWEEYVRQVVGVWQEQDAKGGRPETLVMREDEAGDAVADEDLSPADPQLNVAGEEDGKQ